MGSSLRVFVHAHVMRAFAYLYVSCRVTGIRYPL